MSREHPVLVYASDDNEDSPGDPIPIGPVALSDLLGDLRYDSLAVYLDALACRLQGDSEADGDRGRNQLAYRLRMASDHLFEAASYISESWQICKPYMNK